MGDEEGNSSHADSNEEICEEESFQNLFDRIVKPNGSYIFSPIYVVPSTLREVNSNSFTPRVVSIGPLHKGHTSLKSMENKKVANLTQLLSKSNIGSPETTLKQWMQKVNVSIERIKGSYFGLEKSYTNDELALMMVIDGCFILQFINNLSIKGNAFSDNKLRSRNIALDLVLLENQIPFFVLQDIYGLTIEILRPKFALITMLKDLLDYVNPFEEPLKDRNIDMETTHHILGLLHKYYKPNDCDLKIFSIPTAHSAVELDKVGVKIMPNKSLAWPMAMEFEKPIFWHKPTLGMPIVRVDHFFEVVLRNLIAYEQYSPVDNYVTSYAMAMHMLVATPADISKLAKSDVIISHLGSNEKASNMISSICKNVNLQDFYYMEPWKNIDQYCKNYWRRNFAVFKGTYIDTPWKVIALLAAIIVFLITLIQFFRQVVTPYV